MSTSFDASIPLLTEVIGITDTAATPAAVTSPPMPSVAPAYTPVALAPPAPVDRQQLQQEMTENVLQSLLAQLDSVIEQKLEEQLDAALAVLGQHLKQQIKKNLEQALEETVLLAVAQEMARNGHSQPPAPESP
ncbi:hypothetical protein RGU70_06635 [Herbaspirillum sp. RTI4]|uniref:hypothetical protein n=1 Tax=Herbaspirillum sp. RTI4 TaxID=3048640 RepID=UPI002AB43CFE|nr:hypothetical protein [Herbaspirillum sp. RTI4]MDY7577991.1 hypothetical protein [Herbaspirillum sp. RTI4]MEA9982079.1 hypothetical protein [Herbaspirillum sp. RTI4]